MKIKILLALLCFTTLSSCQFNKSAKKDFATGLSASGDGISCNDVYLSDGENKINRNSFIYGEKFYINFNHIEGFKKEGNSVFPGLELLITGQKGDTIMYNRDLYAENTKGYDMDPLLLQAIITTGNPIHSEENYTVHTNIWDKKGAGTYTAEMDFDVKPNDKINIEAKDISYKEIYLFIQKTKTTIIDNKAEFDKEIYVMFEGLEGFTQEDGKVSLGLSMKAKDAEGKMVVNEADLIGDSAMAVSEIKKQLTPNFIFTSREVASPIDCEVIIWDKKSDRNIKVTTSLTLE